MSVETEPFLEDYRIVFNTDYILYDNAMSGSQVQLYHLKIPKSAIVDPSMHPTSPSVAPLPSDGVRQKKSPTQATPGRLLKGLLTKNVEQLKDNSQAEEPSSPPRNRHSRAPEAEANSPQSQKEVPSKSSPVKSSLPTQSLPVDEFWISPLAQTDTKSYYFSIDKTNRKERIFSLVTKDTKMCIISAIQTPSGADIYDGNKIIGQIHLSNNKAFAVVEGENGSQEVAAIQYSKSFTDRTQQKEFYFYIPALKKRDKKNKVLVIPPESESGLIHRAEIKSKEAIIMKTRAVKDDDFTFGGIMKMSDRGNFILFHSSSASRVVASFGLLDESGMYEALYAYPLCPMQGFVSSVGSMLLE